MRQVRRVIKKLTDQDRPVAPTGAPTMPIRSRWHDGLDHVGGCLDGMNDEAISAVVVGSVLAMVFLTPT